jgi:ribonuclease VapC
MVVDTSAIIAILQDEPERRQFNLAIESAERCAMSVATLVETSIVIEARKGPQGAQYLDLFLATAGIELVTVDTEQAEIARQGFRRFGKGRHPASLNYGDCFSYALAISRNEPLLFKGTDFGKTDVIALVPET